MSPISYSLIIIGVLSIFSFADPIVSNKGVVAFQYLTSDSVLIDVYEEHDSAGLLIGYTAEINTPVCENQLCYDVELDFNWDLLGNFTNFFVHKHKPLTKLDHVPFNRDDYEQLKRILLTKSPSFIHLRREELIVKSTNPDLDGMTGATVKAVKKDMVEGAIYTCYTLWHIANGGISFEIQEHTKKKLDENLIPSLLYSLKVDAYFFLIENMKQDYFKLFLNDIIGLADGLDPYYLGQLIKKMPKELFGESNVQELFIRHFSSLEYTPQQELILKMENTEVPLNKPKLTFFMEQIQKHKGLLNDRLISLLCRKTTANEVDVLKNLFDRLHKDQIEFSTSSRELLISLGDKYPALKNRARRLRRSNK